MYFEFTMIVISVCGRACNQVADSLAAYGASLDAAASDIFMDHAPEFVFRWHPVINLELTFNGMLFPKKK